jgi:hypothetical protein
MSISQKRRILQAENKKWPAHLVPVPEALWPHVEADIHMLAVLRSRDFLVQCIAEAAGIVRLSICRTNINSQGDWTDGITWDELQRLKREAGYGDADAVEIYPSDRDVIHVANIRHLWVCTTPIPFAWRKSHA